MQCSLQYGLLRVRYTTPTDWNMLGMNPTSYNWITSFLLVMVMEEMVIAQ
jgi:hypothetical protein